MCCSEIFPNIEDQAAAEDTTQQKTPDPGFGQAQRTVWRVYGRK